MKIVHMILGEEGAKLPEGEVLEVKTRCGRVIERPVVTANVGPTCYELVARNGNQFFCANRARFVTCVKCKNLLTVGTIYVRPSRTADTTQPTDEDRGPGANRRRRQARAIRCA